MKRLLTILFVLVSLVLGQSVLGQAQFAIPILVVNTSFVNIRSGDGPQYPVVVTVVGGTELSVLGTNKSNTWYYVTTPVGPGWVDVSFTLARGSFQNVPVLSPTVAAAPQLPTPLTIGLPTTATLTAFTTVTAQTAIQTSTVVTLNVISVNLRAQPGDDAPIIAILFKDPNNISYAVAGYAYDGVGVQWAAIVVPGLGTGWVEAAKLVVQPVGSVASATSSSLSGLTAAAAPGFTGGVAHLIINTSFQNVRLGPGAQFPIIASFAGGTDLPVTGITADGAWFEVFGSFGNGWISSQFVLFRGDISAVPVIHGAY